MSKITMWQEGSVITENIREGYPNHTVIETPRFQ